MDDMLLVKTSVRASENLDGVVHVYQVSSGSRCFEVELTVKNYVPSYESVLQARVRRHVAILLGQ